MKIPIRFKLLGYTIEVERDAALIHRDDARGLAVYRDSKIILQPSTEAVPQPQAHVEQAFCHELMHYLLHFSGLREENENERVVDLLAGLLHQALTTMEYEEGELGCLTHNS